MDNALLWLLLEAGAALALVLLLIWWTLPRKKRPDADRAPRADAGRDATR